MLPKALAGLLGEDSDCGHRDEDRPDLTAERSAELLALGKNPNNLQVGDAVVRSEIGERAIRFPDPETQQKAVIVAVYDDYRFESNGQVYNGLVDIALDHFTVKTFQVDLRHYKKA